MQTRADTKWIEVSTVLMFLSMSRNHKSEFGQPWASRLGVGLMPQGQRAELHQRAARRTAEGEMRPGGRREFLEREDEGMSVLLDLNDALGTLREDPAAADNAGAAPLCSPPAADDAEEETGHPEQPASGRPAGDSTQLIPTLETQAVRETVRDEGIRSRGRDSISNSCWAPSGFRKDFRINGHVVDVESAPTYLQTELTELQCSDMLKSKSHGVVIDEHLHSILRFSSAQSRTPNNDELASMEEMPGFWLIPMCIRDQEEEFVKKCMIIVCDVVCPDKRQAFA
ncbi:hypothetical protein L3Q82_017300 [Scortum barcoo]|uniref:Uncharacterized protein n=1 Tax=Scortum barcoo TaxID=214431 RepID=A0ACB8VNE5_9TELE|nr:hypothetical protein L3Q82_017300 [Scortum barcoo]